jgi:hypothetical protein
MPRLDFIQAPTLSTFQLTALSALITTNEKMAATGELSIERATTLRWLVAQTLTAFRMPAVYERSGNDNTSLDDIDRVVAAVAVEIGERA